MFTPEEILARLSAQSFVPPRLFTSSGQSYDITHPDLVLVGRRSLIIGVASNDNPTPFETASRVALMYVTDVQDLSSASPPGNNGPT